MFEKLGATNDAEAVGGFLQGMGDLVSSGRPDDGGKLFETVLPVVFINPSCSDGVTEIE